MMEKQSNYVMIYRVTTQRYRKNGQIAVIVSVPLFLLGIALLVGDQWLARAARWSLLEASTVAVLGATWLAVVGAIVAHVRSFARIYAVAERREGAQQRHQQHQQRENNATVKRFETKYW